MNEKTLKTIEFTTENGGVKPATRKGVKSQALKHLGLNLGDLEKMADGRYGMPVAIDYLTKETIYLLVDTSVGFAPKAKAKKGKAATEPVEIPNLF